MPTQASTYIDYHSESQLFLQKANPQTAYATTPDERIVVEKKFLLCTRPNEAALKKQAEKLARELKRRYPDECISCVYDYAPQQLSGNKWRVGVIELRRGLGVAAAKIACRGADESVMNQYSIDDIDQFGILKLLPFQRKLELISRVLGNKKLSETLSAVILSDLVDEQVAFRQRKWSGVLPKDKLPVRLGVVRSFVEFDFSTLCGSTDGKQFLKELLVRYELLISEQPSFVDYILPRRRNRILTKVCEEFIQRLFAEVGVTASELSKLRKEYRKEFDQTHKSGVEERRVKLLNAYSRPLGNGLFFSNDKGVVSTVSLGVRTVDKEGNIAATGLFNEDTSSFWRFTDEEHRTAAITAQHDFCNSALTPTSRMRK